MYLMLLLYLFHCEMVKPGRNYGSRKGKRQRTLLQTRYFKKCNLINGSWLAWHDDLCEMLFDCALHDPNSPSAEYVLTISIPRIRTHPPRGHVQLTDRRHGLWSQPSQAPLVQRIGAQVFGHLARAAPHGHTPTMTLRSGITNCGTSDGRLLNLSCYTGTITTA